MLRSVGPSHPACHWGCCGSHEPVTASHRRIPECGPGALRSCLSVWGRRTNRGGFPPDESIGRGSRWSRTCSPRGPGPAPALRVGVAFRSRVRTAVLRRAVLCFLFGFLTVSRVNTLPQRRPNTWLKVPRSVPSSKMRTDLFTLECRPHSEADRSDLWSPSLGRGRNPESEPRRGRSSSWLLGIRACGHSRKVYRAWPAAHTHPTRPPALGSPGALRTKALVCVFAELRPGGSNTGGRAAGSGAETLAVPCGLVPAASSPGPAGPSRVLVPPWGRAAP